MQSLHCRRPLGWLGRTCGEAVLAVYSPAQQNSSQRIPLSAETPSETGRVSAPSGLPHTLQVGPGQGSLITLLQQIRSHHILRDLFPLVAGVFPFPHVPKCLPSALSSLPLSYQCTSIFSGPPSFAAPLHPLSFHGLRIPTFTSHGLRALHCTHFPPMVSGFPHSPTMFSRLPSTPSFPIWSQGFPAVSHADGTTVSTLSRQDQPKALSR